MEWQNLSRRTQQKLIKRAEIDRCVICGWDEATCDRHHIVPTSKGGKDTLDNVVILCPNCHRKVHVKGDAFVSEGVLKERSLSWFEWKQFYNPNGRWTPRGYGRVNECRRCGKETSNEKFCSKECWDESQRKCTRPDKQQLQELMDKYPVTQIGKMFGVSDNAVRKWMK